MEIGGVLGVMKDSVAVKWFVCLHKSFPSNLQSPIQATCNHFSQQLAHTYSSNLHRGFFPWYSFKKTVAVGGFL